MILNAGPAWSRISEYNSMKALAAIVHVKKTSYDKKHSQYLYGCISIQLISPSRSGALLAEYIRQYVEIESTYCAITSGV